MFIKSFYACKYYFSPKFKPANPDPDLAQIMHYIFDSFEDLFYRISGMLYQTNENPMLSKEIMASLSKCVNDLKYCVRSKSETVYERLHTYFQKLHLDRYERRSLCEFMEVMQKLSVASIANGRNILRLVMLSQMGQGYIPELDRSIASERLELFFIKLKGVENIIRLNSARILNFKQAIDHYLSDQISTRTTYFLEPYAVDFILECNKILGLETTTNLLQICLRNSNIDPIYWSVIFNCAVVLKKLEDAFNVANGENWQEMQSFLMDIEHRKIDSQVLEKMRLLHSFTKNSSTHSQSLHKTQSQFFEDLAMQQLFLILEYFANCGSAPAQWRLACLYRYNLGVPNQIYLGNPSDSEKVQFRLAASNHWIKIAARSGHIIAQIEDAILNKRDHRLITKIEPKVLELVTDFLDQNDFLSFAQTSTSTLEFARGSFRYWEWGSVLVGNSSKGTADTAGNVKTLDPVSEIGSEGGRNCNSNTANPEPASEATRKSPKNKKFY